jgi:hypothetical protein
VLAESRHPPGEPLVLEYRRGRRQPNRALRGLDRDPPEMRMMGKIFDSVEIAESNLGGFQPLGEFTARMAGELCGDPRVDLGAVRDPPVVVAKARVIGEGGIAEDFGAETPPFPLVLDGDQDFLAVTGRKQTEGWARPIRSGARPP